MRFTRRTSLDAAGIESVEASQGLSVSVFIIMVHRDDERLALLPRGGVGAGGLVCLAVGVRSSGSIELGL